MRFADPAAERVVAERWPVFEETGGHGQALLTRGRRRADAAMQRSTVLLARTSAHFSPDQPPRAPITRSAALTLQGARHSIRPKVRFLPPAGHSDRSLIP